MLVRLALLAALIVGLVAMHQLPSVEGCCGGPTTSVGTAVTDPSGPGHFQPPASSPAVPTPWGAAARVGRSGEHGPVADVLGVCLAMLLVAGGLLVASLRKLAPDALDDRVRPRVAVLATGARRGPPLPRRLAQLQVLRL